MNAVARYLLVFLLGWSGAVFSYSDLIYKKKQAPLDNTTNEKPIESQGQADEVSADKVLNLPQTENGRLIKENKEAEQPKP